MKRLIFSYAVFIILVWLDAMTDADKVDEIYKIFRDVQ